MTGAQQDPVRMRRVDHAPFRDLTSVVIVGDPRGSAQVARLPGLSRLVWDALAEPGSVDEIAALLSEAIDLEDARTKVTEVIELLRELGAVDTA